MSDSGTVLTPSSSSLKRSKTRVCALDPSLTATGYVIVDLHPTQVEIIRYSYFASKSDKPGIRGRQEEQFLYAVQLMGLIEAYGVDEVYAEFPHGSKSNRAAVSLSMVTSVITAICYAKCIPLTYKSQFEAKSHFIGSQIDMKDMVVITALQKYQKFGYKKPKTKKESEATADALAIFDLCFKERFPNQYLQIMG